MVCCRRIVIFDLLYRIFVFLLLMHISSWQLTAHTLHKIPTIIIIKQKRRSRRPNKTQRAILNIFWPRRKTKARRIIMKNKRDFIFILDKNLCFVACFYLSAHNLVGCCCCFFIVVLNICVLQKVVISQGSSLFIAIWWWNECSSMRFAELSYVAFLYKYNRCVIWLHMSIEHSMAKQKPMFCRIDCFYCIYLSCNIVNVIYSVS